MRKVYESADLVDAHLCSHRLQSEGLATTVQGELLTGGMGELPVNATPTVWVLEDADAARALELIAGWQQQAAARADEEWSCPACGETQAASFEVCWSCGRER